MDYINNFSNDWFGNAQIKIRGNYLNFFSKKKILIYGLGKSGLSTFQFLKKKNDIFLYDDYQTNFKSFELKERFIKSKKLSNFNFDIIILSPGIDINNCKLSNFLKKNQKKIFSDLDVFYSYFQNDSITITGTNGKSTTCQLLYEVLSKQNLDVKLVGNIGKPILSVKNVKRKTIFIIEASSYQLEYSKIFRSKLAVILNISPDHIERHKSLKNYIRAKFKLLKSQKKGYLAFVKKDDPLISKELRLNYLRSKVLKVDTKKEYSFLKNLNNDYFLSEANMENLSFVLEISKAFRIKKKFLINTLKNFRGLKYRQQVIYKNQKLTIINDSKSTSFSSTVGILKERYNIYWLLGGVYKKGDKFKLSKKNYKNIKAFIYGKDKISFNRQLKNKIKFKNFDNLQNALKKIFILIKKSNLNHSTILFSPCAASFDSFKNFEDRGFYFNRLVKKYLNGKKINI